jgi:hypothetical protein
MPDPLATPPTPQQWLAEALKAPIEDLLIVVRQQWALFDATDRHQLTRALDLLSLTVQRLGLREAGHTVRLPPLSPQREEPSGDC